MIELELTPKIQEWLNTEPSKRSIPEGAELLLRCTKNRILYQNIMRRPEAKSGVLEYNLQKLLKKRLIDTTHEEVAQLMTKVDAIAQATGLKQQQRSEFQRGRRADHDELPDEIKQLYVDNADIMRRMRDIHTQIRMINSTNSTCPDSDRYPLCKALIAYDKQYRDNWNIYDHYVKGDTATSVKKAEDPRTAAKNAMKLLNLLLGKQAKNPSKSNAGRIRSLYASITNPPESISEKMRTLNLL